MAARESIKVLQECAELQDRKARDYQNEKSRIRQADHYPRGTATILDMVHQKMTRMYSVMEAAEHGENQGLSLSRTRPRMRSTICLLPYPTCVDRWTVSPVIVTS